VEDQISKKLNEVEQEHLLEEAIKSIQEDDGELNG
jgi:hypothetical protein